MNNYPHFIDRNMPRVNNYDFRQPNSLEENGAGKDVSPLRAALHSVFKFKIWEIIYSSNFLLFLLKLC